MSDENTNEAETAASIEKLKADLDTETKRREQAERHNRSLQNDLAKANKNTQDNDMQIVQSGIDKLNTNRSLLLQQLRAAREGGDLDKEIELQDQLTTNAAQKSSLETGLEAMKSGHFPRSSTTQPTPPPTASFLDARVAEMEKAGAFKSAEWMRKHPELATPERFSDVLAAHNLAVGMYKQPAESDGYFKQVETILGLVPRTPAAPAADDGGGKDDTKANGSDNLSSAAAPKRAEVPPSPAPASNGGAARNSVARLTAAEREAAQISGISEEEYAKNKAAEAARNKVH